MTGQQLKNSILQLAVQGKLVPQDPADEPASVLLERIREEKEQLIREKKIKREKNPSQIFRGDDGHFYERVGKADPVCIDEELPFEIPETWEWVHLSDLGTFSSGKTPKAVELSDHGSIPYFKVSDMNSPGNEIFLIHTHSFLANNSYSKTFKEGTIVYPKNGGALFTNKKRILAQKSLVDLNTGTYTPFSKMNLKFIFYVFQTIDFKNYSKGTALPTLDSETLQKVLWGLPPLAEQQRIVAKIEELLPFVARYEESQNKLEKLNTTFPDQLKKSVLQEAIQGKLVPQDPADEPASILLERIRTEKEQLIKEGKIKREKNPSHIYRGNDGHFYEQIGKAEPICIDDQLPFDIPESWEWARLENVSVQIGDIDHKMPPTVEANGIPYISPLNFTSNNGIDFENAKQISLEDYVCLSKKCSPEKNDIIFPRYGTIGVVRMVNTSRKFLTSYSCCTIKNSKRFMSPKYVYYVLQSKFIKDEINRYINKTTQPNVGLKSIKRFLFPLPPLAEQQRIVAKLEQLLPLCEHLK